MRPKIIVFASGTATGGGSGFENLVEATKKGILDADIVAVVSNHERGGIRERAERLGIPFVHFPAPHDAVGYQRIVRDAGAEWIVLMGWLKLVHGLDPRKTINTHPALLSRHEKFGGKGMYDERVHAAVKAAYDAGEITETGFVMHFVTEELDRGPILFEKEVPLQAGMDWEDIQEAVQAAEHEWQPKIINCVVHGKIRWDGKDPHSLVVPNI